VSKIINNKFSFFEVSKNIHDEYVYKFIKYVKLVQAF
jgi:hypothetical protein